MKTLGGIWYVCPLCRRALVLERCRAVDRVFPQHLGHDIRCAGSWLTLRSACLLARHLRSMVERGQKLDDAA